MPLSPAIMRNLAVFLLLGLFGSSMGMSFSVILARLSDAKQVVQFHLGLGKHPQAARNTETWIQLAKFPNSPIPPEMAAEIISHAEVSGNAVVPAVWQAMTGYAQQGIDALRAAATDFRNMPFNDGQAYGLQLVLEQ